MPGPYRCPWSGAVASTERRFGAVCEHASVQNGHLDALRVSTVPTTLTVRPPGGVTQRLSDVVIVALDDSTVTVDMPDGERRIIDVRSVIDIEREHQRRKRWGRVGAILDSLGLTR